MKSNRSLSPSIEFAGLEIYVADTTRAYVIPLTCRRAVSFEAGLSFPTFSIPARIEAIGSRHIVHIAKGNPLIRPDKADV